MAYQETGNVKRWLIATLKAGLTDTKVHDSVAPEKAAYPHLLVSLVTGVDANSSNGTRGASELIFLVKAVCQAASSASAEELMGQADVLLQQQKGDVSGLKVMSCVRESEIAYPEQNEGVTYWHIGGQYRLWVQLA